MSTQVDIADRPAGSASPGPSPPERRRLGARLIVFSVVAAIVVLDQSFKWWAWRNAIGVRMNDGGDVLAPSVVGRWYRAPLDGAALDAVDSDLLLLAGWLFLRRRRPLPVLITGALILGGWSSDILDRLGLHSWTAPGSVRGVVDFIPIGHHYYNVADMFIIGGTPLFAVALAGSLLRRFVMGRPGPADQPTPQTGHPRRARTAVVVAATGVVLAGASGLGAATFGGVTAPVPSKASTTYQAWHVSHGGDVISI